jgi:RNA polymerase sigma-70 factor (ECF subfamily)
MTDSVALLREWLPAVMPRLRRFARTLTHDVQDADDLVQGALERALLRAAQWRAPPEAAAEQIEAAVRRWMFGIVKNAWIDNRRAHRRERAVITGSDDGAAEAPDASHLAVQDRLSIDAAMQRLPEEQQLAVSLVLVEGLSYQEAADVLEIPVGTLTSRLARGREALATLLGGREQPS